MCESLHVFIISLHGLERYYLSVNVRYFKHLDMDVGTFKNCPVVELQTDPTVCKTKGIFFLLT